MAKEATGQTRRRILTLLKQRGATDSTQLAECLSISPMAVRQHLYSLQEQGMVAYEEESRSMGRPAKLWKLTGVADQYFPEAYAELTLSLLEAVTQAFGEVGFNQLLHVRTQQQIQDYQPKIQSQPSCSQKVAALVEIRTREGYMAEVQSLADGSFLLIENHCPICVAAKACTGLCERELEVFQTVLGSDIRVEREEHLIRGDRRCTYSIKTSD